MSELKGRLKESIIHSIILMIISLLITYLIIMNLSISSMSISSIIGVLFLIIYIKSPYKKEHLIVNSWLSMICVIFIGSLIGKIIPPSSLMGVGISVSVVDIISFTKIGTKTTNAKIMASKELMWKLIVYGKSFKNSKAVPTKGLGDFLFYTILLSGFQFFILWCMFNIFRMYNKLDYSLLYI